MLTESEIKELWSSWSKDVASQTHYESCNKRHAACAILPLILSLVEVIGLKERAEFQLLWNAAEFRKSRFRSPANWVKAARKRILGEE